MNLSLFTADGFLFVLRWLHFFFGILWIGHLYYFNLAQGPFMAMPETDAQTKSKVITGLLPKALWWFRWGAMFTFVTGWIYLLMRGHDLGASFMATSWGISILTGALLGSLMWFNVWFVIWPKQQVVIKSAQQVAGGGQAIPEAAGCAARALVVSRTNLLLSVPMLFFMAASSHLAIPLSETSSVGGYFAVFAVIALVVEINALKGKMGPMTTIKGVIHSAFALAVVMYLAMEFML